MVPERPGCLEPRTFGQVGAREKTKHPTWIEVPTDVADGNNKDNKSPLVVIELMQRTAEG